MDQDFELFNENLIDFLSHAREGTLTILTDLEGERHLLLNVERIKDSLIFRYGVRPPEEDDDLDDVIPDEATTKNLAAFETRVSAFSGWSASFKGDWLDVKDDDNEPFSIQINIDEEAFFKAETAEFDLTKNLKKGSNIKPPQLSICNDPLKEAESVIKTFLAGHNLDNDIVVINEDWCSVSPAMKVEFEPDNITIYTGASVWGNPVDDLIIAVYKEAIVLDEEKEFSLSVDGETLSLSIEDDDLLIVSNTDFLNQCGEYDDYPDTMELEALNLVIQRELKGGFTPTSDFGQSVSLRREFDL